ncbi:autophagy protein 5 [Clonorchis sinensis]|uniref:Autophagy protein 5 n=1 Tax=Clonorchis sinensis TaxID=79923 RepID=H2KTJ7_CLOSI|nr:autophagy protein 5 [Clonorchis sinensis]
MPFNCWCLTCKNPIGMGVRYNAEKTKVGMYHSTPIYKFTMPCHLCAGTIVMQTDPKNFTYIILEGARRKVQNWDAEDNEQPVIPDAEEKRKLALDAMYHLEHEQVDKTKGQSVLPALQQLETDRKSLRDDFALNTLARKHFRVAKRAAAEKADSEQKLMNRLSLFGSEVTLLPEDQTDSKTAKLIRLGHIQRKNSENKLRSTDNDPIFGVAKDIPPRKRRSSVGDQPTGDESSSHSNSTGASTQKIPLFEPLANLSKKLKQRSEAFSVSDKTKVPTPGLIKIGSSVRTAIHSRQLNPLRICCVVMPEDENVLRSIWEAKLPVCFKLAQEDLVREDHVPVPFYMFVPRVSYFPLVIDRVVRYFIEFTEYASEFGDQMKEIGTEVNKATEIGVEAGRAFDSTGKTVGSEIQRLSSVVPPEHRVWLEYAHQPLKWHYPIGLLFDLHADGTELPWNVTVHFHNYPSDILLSPPVHRRATEIHFMSVVKEADALKHRSQVMNQMQARDHHQIWTGILNYNFQQYWDINRRLMEPVVHIASEHHSPSRSVSAVTESDTDPIAGTNTQSRRSTTTPPQTLKTFRHIPCRLYRAGKTRADCSTGYIQKRIPPCTSDGVYLTVLDVTTKLLSVDDNSDTISPATSEYVFLLHGICLPLDTPIQWICEHMAYADNFVHIVAWPRSRFNRAVLSA